MLRFLIACCISLFVCSCACPWHVSECHIAGAHKTECNKTECNKTEYNTAASLKVLQPRVLIETEKGTISVTASTKLAVQELRKAAQERKELIETERKMAWIKCIAIVLCCLAGPVFLHFSLTTKKLKKLKNK